MSAKISPDQQIAETLAAPFTPVKGHSGKPLSHRALENGGMVVITADGRKLWFTAEEVAQARAELAGEPCSPRKSQAASRPAMNPAQPMTAPPQAPRTYNGLPVLTALPPRRTKPNSNERQS